LKIQENESCISIFGAAFKSLLEPPLIQHTAEKDGNFPVAAIHKPSTKMDGAPNVLEAAVAPEVSGT